MSYRRKLLSCTSCSCRLRGRQSSLFKEIKGVYNNNKFKLMLNSQDSFHELEQILRSLQENLEPGSKAISTDPAPHNVSDEELDD